MKTRLGEGCRTEANAADELSCSPSTASELAGATSSSSAYLLAASPLADLGVFGEESVVYWVCVCTQSVLFSRRLHPATKGKRTLASASSASFTLRFASASFNRASKSVAFFVASSTSWVMESCMLL